LCRDLKEVVNCRKANRKGWYVIEYITKWGVKNVYLHPFVTPVLFDMWKGTAEEKESAQTIVDYNSRHKSTKLK